MSVPEVRARARLVAELAAAASIAIRDPDAEPVTMRRCAAVALRHSPEGFERIVRLYVALVEASPRRTCPECRGSGLCDYKWVGAGAPCMTCGDRYERGRGWIDERNP